MKHVETCRNMSKDVGAVEAWISMGHSSASSFWCEIRLRSFMALRFFANKYLRTENGLDSGKLCA